MDISEAVISWTQFRDFQSSNTALHIRMIKLSKQLNQSDIEPASKAFVEAELMRQEHRLHRILFNFFLHSRSWPEGDPRRSAAKEAVLYRLAIALLPGPATAGIGITAVIGVYLAWQANNLFEAQNTMLAAQAIQIQAQTEQIRIQTSLSEASRRASLNFELANILEGVSNVAAAVSEPNLTRGISLPKSLYGRIVALSRNLRPYRYLGDNGEIIGKALSPERGQLLIALHATGVDLAPIASQIDLSYADLDRANLHGAIMRELRLVGATFREADLTHVDFSGADLSFADLSDADLQFCDFGFADVEIGSKLANLKGTKFDRANCNQVFFTDVPNNIIRDHARFDSFMALSALPDDFSMCATRKLPEANSINDFPPQVIRKAFEWSKLASAPDHEDTDGIISKDPFTNAKQLTQSITVLVSPDPLSNHMAVSMSALSKNDPPIAYWMIPESIRTKFYRSTFFDVKLPAPPAPPLEENNE